MMNVAVDWYTNTHTVDNGVPTWVIFENLKKLKVCKTGQACITFHNFVQHILWLSWAVTTGFTSVSVICNYTPTNQSQEQPYGPCQF